MTGSQPALSQGNDGRDRPAGCDGAPRLDSSQAEADSALLETLLAVAPAGIAFHDCALRFVRINDALAAINGLPAPQHLGRPLRDVLPDLAPVLEPLLRRVLDTGEPLVDQQVWGQTPAAPGAQRHWLASYYPVRAGDRRIVGVAAVVVEVTERRRAAARVAILSETSRQLAEAGLALEAVLDAAARRLVEVIGDGAAIFLTSPDGEWLDPVRVYSGDAALDEVIRLIVAARRLRVGEGITGRVAATGEPALVPAIDPAVVRAGLPPEYGPILDRAAVHAIVAVAMRVRGRSIGVVTLARTAAGRTYTDEDRALLQELADRAALAIDNARLYRDERAARAEAEAALRLREAFLSTAAHELKTPVTALSGFAQVTLRRLRREAALDPERVRHALGVIEKHGLKLDRLIALLLDVSRLDTGKLVLEREPTDLAQLVGSVVATFQETLPDRRIVARVPQSPVVAEVDPLRLEQVLANLLDNATKFSPPEREIEVELALADAGTARLAVRDHGIGIPPERRAHVFERFYQAHGEGHRSGLGVGLYVSREIVALHGGRIEAEGPADGGTRVTVELPLSPPAPAAPYGAPDRAR